MAENKRNYGIDLLRIISMLMTVVLHVLGQGVLTDAEPFSAKFEIAWFFECCFLCAVNCFAIITGYVSIDAKKYRYSDLATLWLRIAFYSIVISIIGYYALPGTVSVRDIVKSPFPVFTGKWWYVSAYFVLYLLMPLFKLAINALNQKQFKVLLIIAGILLANDVFCNYLGYTFVWLIYMFFVGAYIKRYVDIEKLKSYRLLICFFASVLGNLAFKYIYERIYSDIYGSYFVCRFSEYYNFPFVCLCGIFLFLFFAKLKPSQSFAKIITFLSPLAFSVYLIHVHPVIWDNYIDMGFTCLVQSSTPVMILRVFGTAIAIFSICILVDIPREYIFKWLKIKERLRAFEEKHIKSIW